MELKLERKSQQDESEVVPGISFTPGIGGDYWAYRVSLGEKQAVLGFPKFGTVGIGFAEEEDWNTNLPFESTTDEIFKHIQHNKGDESVSDEDVRAAIRLIQDAVEADRRDSDPTASAIDELTAEQAHKALHWMVRNISRDDTARAVNWGRGL